MLGAIQILHVDDEPDFADLTATYLQREDDRFTVETATSVEGGLDRLGERVDCIVSDYDMPDMNGLEFLKTVREEYRDLPFILFTGKGSEEVASDAIAAGVTDYLQKGTGTSQYTVLANRVRNAVEKQQAQRNLANRQKRLNLFFEQSPLGVIEWDEDFTIVRANESATEILGYPENDLAGQSWEMFVPDAERDDVETVGSELLRNEGGYYNVNENVRKDGERITCEWHNRIVTDDAGEVVSIFSQFQDITERVTRKRELKAQVTAMEAATDGIAILNDEREYVYTNASHATIYGFEEPNELLGKTWRACYDDATVPRFENEVLPTLEEKGGWRGEMRVTTADGRSIDQQLALTQLSDGRVVCVVRDITEKRKRQQELEAERRFISQALDALDDLFYVLDDDGSLQQWNAPVSEITGYDESEIADMQAIEFFPAGERETVAERIEKTLTEGRATVETHLLTADEKRIPYEFTGARLTDENGNTTGMVGLGRDLTERRKKEQRFQALVKGSNDIISVLDTEGRFRYQSPSLERILGYDPEEVTGDMAWEYIHPDDRETVVEQFEKWVVDPDATADVLEYRLRHADGSWRWIETRWSDQHENPTVDGYVVNSRDITDRKKRERQLTRERERYTTLFETLPAPIVHGTAEDGEPVVQTVNPAFEDAFGYDAEMITGEKLDGYIVPDDRSDTVEELNRQVLNEGEIRTEVQRETTDGVRTFQLDLRTRNTESGRTDGYAVYTDITERKEYEQKLKAQNAQLEEFASIVSHDLRSPLSVADGHLELARETCESDHLDRVAEAIARSQTLIEDLLVLARSGQQVNEINPVTLAEVAEQSWQTVETNSATLETKRGRTIRADRSQLQQLLENLYRNAIEHGEEDLTVSVGRIDDGFYVADTGPGIAESERDEIFDAGYSTTERGAGIGLRIVEQIADAHGWDVSVTDSETGGARFEVTGVETVE